MGKKDIIGLDEMRLYMKLFVYVFRHRNCLASELERMDDQVAIKTIYKI